MRKYEEASELRVVVRFAHEMNGDWYPWCVARGACAPACPLRWWPLPGAAVQSVTALVFVAGQLPACIVRDHCIGGMHANLLPGISLCHFHEHRWPRQPLHAGVTSHRLDARMIDTAVDSSPAAHIHDEPAMP